MSKYHPRCQGCGEVYFVKCGDSYKIGSTRDLYKRLRTLQVANSEKITLVHSIKTTNMKLTEKLFQALFEKDNKRERGEWFRLTDKDIEYIKSGNYSKAILKSIGKWDDGAKASQTVGELLAM